MNAVSVIDHFAHFCALFCCKTPPLEGFSSLRCETDILEEDSLPKYGTGNSFSRFACSQILPQHESDCIENGESGSNGRRKEVLQANLHSCKTEAQRESMCLTNSPFEVLTCINFDIGNIFLLVSCFAPTQKKPKKIFLIETAQEITVDNINELLSKETYELLDSSFVTFLLFFCIFSIQFNILAHLVFFLYFCFLDWFECDLQLRFSYLVFRFID